MWLIDIIWSLYLKWNFLLSNELGRDLDNLELVSRISQWLNQTPGYNTEELVDYLVSFEEDFLIDDVVYNDDLTIHFHDSYKQYSIFRAKQLCCILLDAPNLSELNTTIFIADAKYYEITLLVLNYLEAGYYDEYQLNSFLRKLRKDYFKKYSWKTNMLEGN
jgi:hypothetical protein